MYLAPCVKTMPPPPPPAEDQFLDILSLPSQPQLARGYNATKRLAVITGRDKNYGAGDYYRAVMQVWGSNGSNTTMLHCSLLWAHVFRHVVLC